MALRRFEDVAVGETFDCGSVSVSEAEIIAFAERYDPQPIHLDPDHGEALSDGVVASGWHTASLAMRRCVDGFLADLAVVCATGIGELRWHEPLRPDDELAVTAEIVARDPVDDDRGVVDVRVTGTVDGETVMERTDEVLVRRA
jgi:acyl dehydratase